MDIANQPVLKKGSKPKLALLSLIGKNGDLMRKRSLLNVRDTELGLRDPIVSQIETNLTIDSRLANQAWDNAQSQSNSDEVMFEKISTTNTGRMGRLQNQLAEPPRPRSPFHRIYQTSGVTEDLKQRDPASPGRTSHGAIDRAIDGCGSEAHPSSASDRLHTLGSTLFGNEQVQNAVNPELNIPGTFVLFEKLGISSTQLRDSPITRSRSRSSSTATNHESLWPPYLNSTTDNDEPLPGQLSSDSWDHGSQSSWEVIDHRCHPAFQAERWEIGVTEERRLGNLDDGSATAVEYQTSPATSAEGHSEPKVEANFTAAVVGHCILSPAKAHNDELIVTGPAAIIPGHANTSSISSKNRPFDDPIPVSTRSLSPPETPTKKGKEVLGATDQPTTATKPNSTEAKPKRMFRQHVPVELDLSKVTEGLTNPTLANTTHSSQLSICRTPLSSSVSNSPTSRRTPTTQTSPVPTHSPPYFTPGSQSFYGPLVQQTAPVSPSDNMRIPRKPVPKSCLQTSPTRIDLPSPVSPTDSMRLTRNPVRIGSLPSSPTQSELPSPNSTFTTLSRWSSKNNSFSTPDSHSFDTSNSSSFSSLRQYGSIAQSEGEKITDAVINKQMESPEMASPEMVNSEMTPFEKLRHTTHTEITYHDATDSRLDYRKHPNHNRVWNSKNLHCTMCQPNCRLCQAPCCAYSDAEQTLGNYRSLREGFTITEARKIMEARKLLQRLNMLGPLSYDAPTFIQCTNCKIYVCPDCAGVCPIMPCCDRTCKECNPDQWQTCYWH